MALLRFLDLERAGASLIFLFVLLGELFWTITTSVGPTAGQSAHYPRFASKAFTTQSVLAAKVQQTYTKPYFLLWVVHIPRSSVCAAH
jgi:hypothetical protein